MPQAGDVQPFQIDHIRAQKHGGPTALANLSWSCLSCNVTKGPNIAGIDPASQTMHRLFDPRSDRWADHFEWQGPSLIGRTPIGRATIEVLGINRRDRLEHRRLLVAAGLFPLD
jgi:hypothetical protein